MGATPTDCVLPEELVLCLVFPAVLWVADASSLSGRGFGYPFWQLLGSISMEAETSEQMVSPAHEAHLREVNELTEGVSISQVHCLAPTSYVRRPRYRAYDPVRFSSKNCCAGWVIWSSAVDLTDLKSALLDGKNSTKRDVLCFYSAQGVDGFYGRVSVGLKGRVMKKPSRHHRPHKLGSP